MNEHNQSDIEDKNYDWAKNAEDAAKIAEAKVEQLKKEAQQELHYGKEYLNNVDESK